MTNSTVPFSDRLISAIKDRRAPIVVGLDPHIGLLPGPFRAKTEGASRSKIAAEVSRFCVQLLEQVHDVAPAVKPQVAFFERLGPAGYEALETVVDKASELGLIVISDSKRGDIGSTASAYASYHLERSDAPLPGLGADAMTVNPYLGMDTFEPFMPYVQQGKGLFVLAKTSNPGSSDLQDIETQDGTLIYDHTCSLVHTLGRDTIGENGYSSIGVVVGATYPEQGEELRRRHPSLFFLVPGYGAQGATAADVAKCFDKNGLGAIVNASRSILFAYRSSDCEESDWASASRMAAIKMRDELHAAIG